MNEKDFLIEDNILIKYNGKDKTVVVPENVYSIKRDAFCESDVVTLILTDNVIWVDINGKLDPSGTCLSGATYDPPLLAPLLEEILVTSGNRYLSSVDGVLYDKNKETLIKVPEAKEGTIIIDKNAKNIHPGAFAEGEVSSIIFPNSMTAYLLDNGLAYIGDNNNVDTIALPPEVRISKVFEKTYIISKNHEIEEYNYLFPNAQLCDKASKEIFRYNNDCELRAESLGNEFNKKEIDLSGLPYGKSVEPDFFYMADNSLEIYYSEPAKSKCYQVENGVLTFNSEDDFYSCLYNNYSDMSHKQLIVGNNPDIKEIVIPEGVENLPDGCFEGFKDLEKIHAPTVVSIGPNSFLNCFSLKEIYFSPELVFIGENAFSFCSSLTTIHIPDAMLPLGDNAFRGCKNLEPESISKENFNKNKRAFKGCDKINNAYQEFKIDDIDKLIEDMPSANTVNNDTNKLSTISTNIDAR